MKAHFLKNAFIGLAVVAGLSAAIMLLWNVAVPRISGLTTINFWQALILLLPLLAVSVVDLGMVRGKLKRD